MLESPILYLKVMRILMFQLSGFYCIGNKAYYKSYYISGSVGLRRPSK